MHSVRSSVRQSFRTCHDCNTTPRRCLRTRGSVSPLKRAPRPAPPPQSLPSQRSGDEPVKISSSSPSSGLDELLAIVSSQDGATPRKKSSRRLAEPAEPPLATVPPTPAQPASKPKATSTPTPPPVKTSPTLPPLPSPPTPPTPTATLHTYPPPPTAYSSYTHAPAPNPPQLAYSARFFTRGAPTFLHSSAHFRTLPMSSVPEVAFLGRSNVGKSSLLNALVERTGVKIANVSGKPGRTRTMNAFGVGGVRVVGGKPGRKGPVRGKANVGVRERGAGRGAVGTYVDALEEGDEGGRGGRGGMEKTEEEREREHERWVGRGGLVVLDMPGYGKASREEWGKEIVKYLTARKQLRRTFLLIDSTHSLKSTDIHLLRLLSSNSLPHQIILTKIDRLLLPSSKTSNSTFLGHLSTKMPELCASIRAQLDKEVYRDQRGKEIRMGTRASGDLLGVSGEVGVPKGERGRKMGVDVLRWEVLCAVGLECDQEGQPRRVEHELAGEEEWDED